MEGGLDGEELEAVRVEVQALLSEGVGGAKSGADVAERQQFLAQAEQMLRHLTQPDQPLIVQAITTLLSLRLDPSPPLRRVLPSLLESLLPQLLHTPNPHPYSLLVNIAGTMAALMEDESPMVARRALQCLARVLSDLLRAVTEAPAKESQALFAEVLRLKKLAFTMATTARHPAIRIQVVKLVESFVLCFSSAENHKWGFSLEDIPPQHPVLAPSSLIDEGRECLNALLQLSKRTDRERTSGERMAIINCLALIMSQRPSLAREVVPHLSQIDPALPAAFEPGPLANVRQTLRLGLQYIYKLPVCGTHGFAGAVGAAIQGIGAQREKSYEESLEEEEEQQQQQTFAASHKRKAEELGAAGGDDKARRDLQPQPPAKRLATELQSPPASSAGPEAIPGIGAGTAFGQLQLGAGTAGLPGFGLPPASGFPPMASATALSPPGTGAAPQPTVAAGAGHGMGESGDLGIPPLVLSRFVLDHLANLPPARELVRNEPLPPMDIDNLVKLLGTLTAARIQLQTGAPQPTAAAVPSRDPRARRESDDHSATVPALPGFGIKPEKTEQKAPTLAAVKVAAPVLPIQIVLPTIAPVPIADVERQRANTLMRIVRAEARIATAGAGGLRRGLVARLTSMHALDDPVIAQLIDNIAHNLPLRHELALEWLYQEAVRAMAERSGEMDQEEDRSGEEEEEEAGEEGAEETRKRVSPAAAAAVSTSTTPTIAALHEFMDLEFKDELAPSKTEGGVKAEGAGGGAAGGRYGEVLRRLMEAVDAAPGAGDGEEGQPPQPQQMSPAQEAVYCRLLANVPLLTPQALSLIESYVASGRRVNLGLTLLKDMVTERPSVRTRCLDALLSYTLHPDESVRGQAVRLVANKLFTEEEYLAEPIERFARDALFAFIDAQQQQQQQPIDVEKKEPSAADEAASDAAGAGKEQEREIALYFALCMKKPELLDGMLEAYTRAGVAVKKAIHRQAPHVVHAIGMGHPYVRRMTQTFPRGAETFVLQALHLLTDHNAVPTPELTEAAREAARRTHDARFLIPVLAGLGKDDTIASLPRLINLPPAIVKNVIHRLLNNKPTPITPEELLVALHVVDQEGKKEKVAAAADERDRVPLRKIVDAIQHCMEQKQYSQGILAIVLQQLIDVSPLPALLMRTIIQTVHKYPKLTGFVMGLLARLITKQVWTDERLWQGWIKCCRSTTPHSYAVVLQLPPRQLEDVLQKHPDLKEPLARYQQTNPALMPRASLALLGLAAP